MAETKEQYNERKRRERAAQRARDPEAFIAKSRAANAKWEAAHPGYFRAKAKEGYYEHREERIAYSQAWRRAHFAEWQEYMRAWRDSHKEYRAEHMRQWEDENPENVRANHKRAKHKRRESEFPYARLDPWPTDCQCCHNPIDGAIKHRTDSKDPYGETLGHEPPIHWADNHPEYIGTYVIRPEHWKCNLKKGVKPDWEL
jgi:hypothetical protein